MLGSGRLRLWRICGTRTPRPAQPLPGRHRLPTRCGLSPDLLRRGAGSTAPDSIPVAPWWRRKGVGRKLPAITFHPALCTGSPPHLPPGSPSRCFRDHSGEPLQRGLRWRICGGEQAAGEGSLTRGVWRLFSPLEGARDGALRRRARRCDGALGAVLRR